MTVCHYPKTCLGWSYAELPFLEVSHSADSAALPTCCTCRRKSPWNSGFHDESQETVRGVRDQQAGCRWLSWLRAPTLCSVFGVSLCGSLKRKLSCIETRPPGPSRPLLNQQQPPTFVNGADQQHTIKNASPQRIHKSMAKLA